MSIDTTELRALRAEATTGEHMQAEGAILEILAALPDLLDAIDASTAETKLWADIADERRKENDEQASKIADQAATIQEQAGEIERMRARCIDLEAQHEMWMGFTAKMHGMDRIGDIFVPKNFLSGPQPTPDAADRRVIVLKEG